MRTVEPDIARQGGQRDDPARLAAEALRLVGADAALADATAVAAIELARLTGDRASESTAWRARGLAARERDDLVTAESALREALTMASPSGVEAARARLSMSLVLSERGLLTAAEAEAVLALDSLPADERHRALVHLALIQQRQGHLDEALDTSQRAEAALASSGDELWLGRLLNNRGILHAYKGSRAPADRDLAAAQELFTRLGQSLLAADACWNRGFAAGVTGDAGAALRWFEEAAGRLDALGVSRRVHDLDQTQVLLSAGLVDEAVESVERVTASLDGLTADSDAAEARLLHAEALLAAGRLAEARTQASLAAQAFSMQGRGSLALLCDYTRLRAALDDRDPAWDDAPALQERLAADGWSVAATEVMLLQTRRLLRLQAPVPAPLKAAAGVAARTGSAGQRLRAWHTVALLREADGDLVGAKAALQAAFRVHDTDRALLHATELQVHVAARLGDIAQDALRLALAGRRAGGVLTWSERWRAVSVLQRPAAPAYDEALTAALNELRAVTVELEQNRWGPQPPVRALQSRQRDLERRVRGLARVAATPAPAQDTPGDGLTLRDVQAALGARTLLDFVTCRGRLLCLAVVAGRTRIVDLCAAADVSAELVALRFALDRYARGGSARLMTANAQALAGALARLDALLLTPLGRQLDGGEVVVVPTGELHALPWSMLPRLSGASVAVAPSVRAWLRAARSPLHPVGSVAAVGGPGLAQASAELADVAAAYDLDVQVLPGDRATAAAVKRVLEQDTCVHLACHGRFRSDSPLFSNLQLADGPLSVYDLESLRAVPALVVLSACDVGLSSVHPGDELMGLVSALLRLGTRCIVASVAPVRDDETRALMGRFHRGIAAGVPPAAALRDAASAMTGAVTFVCFGAG